MANSSGTLHGQMIPSECDLYIFLGGTVDHTTPEAYAVLVFLIVLNTLTLPITTALNGLVIIAVKTKPRLKAMSNIVLGCMASTDGLMGLIGQPLLSAEMIVLLQGEASSENCMVIELAKHILRVLGAASLYHLALMNIERYLAIQHPFAHITMVTATRILYSSAVAWIAAFLLTVPLAIINNTIYLAVSNISTALCMAITFFCQVVLYFVTRRHEKEIAAHQVSVEARQKFLADKKALRLTTTVLFVLLFTYSPLIVARVLIINSVIDSVNVAYIAIFATSMIVILNSLINPVIYCVRIRRFRVAFIEMLLRKSNAQAEDIERKLFGTLNAVAPLQEGQGREEGQINSTNNNTNSTSNDNNNNSNSNDIHDNSNSNNNCNNNSNNNPDFNNSNDNNDHGNCNNNNNNDSNSNRNSNNLNRDSRNNNSDSNDDDHGNSNNNRSKDLNGNSNSNDNTKMTISSTTMTTATAATTKGKTTSKSNDNCDNNNDCSNNINDNNNIDSDNSDDDDDVNSFDSNNVNKRSNDIDDISSIENNCDNTEQQ